MKCIRVQRPKMLQEFCNKSMFTFEGIDIQSEKGREAMLQFEEEARKAGFNKKEMIGYYFNGAFMNDCYRLTGSNAYPDDLVFLVIPDLYNPMFKIACGARWFDDIVANNSIRQNAEEVGLEPDYR